MPRVLNYMFDFFLPLLWRRTTRPYTQEHHHTLLLNGEFNLGRSVAEVSLLTMHTLTYGAGIPIMYPLCALGLLLITARIPTLSALTQSQMLCSCACFGAVHCAAACTAALLARMVECFAAVRRRRFAHAARLRLQVDNKLKLKYTHPIPRRFNSACTDLYLNIVKGMVYVHTAFALWMFSYFRTWGQIAGALPPLC